MKRILVVDDDPLVSLSIKLMLEREGFETVLADGGVTGLQALEADHFDLMIVDIFMPQMRGFESVRVFHQRAPRVPLVAISGYAFAQYNTPARISCAWRSNLARRAVCASRSHQQH